MAHKVDQCPRCLKINVFAGVPMSALHRCKHGHVCVTTDCSKCEETREEIKKRGDKPTSAGWVTTKPGDSGDGGKTRPRSRKAKAAEGSGGVGGQGELHGLGEPE